MITNRLDIAQVWDEALDLGFRSSSISFVETMIAEHRLSQILNGDWDDLFRLTSESAERLQARITEVHPDLYCVSAESVGAELHDPSHILINTSKTRIDARLWAKNLSEFYALDVEKASLDTLLLLCAAPINPSQIDQTLTTLKAALDMSMPQKEIA